jgi:hypothetical protein
MAAGGEGGEGWEGDGPELGATLQYLAAAEQAERAERAERGAPLLFFVSSRLSLASDRPRSPNATKPYLLLRRDAAAVVWQPSGRRGRRGRSGPSSGRVRIAAGGDVISITPPPILRYEIWRGACK